MDSFKLRERFFSFFQRHGHTKIASSSLIPAEDPTLLFANAGMNQFKDVFLGKETRSYSRAVTVQKCVRAGGKHNDLDNVGFTKRHLTFFEMMGNFSFGDYFKKEAITYAWEFLTNEIKLPANTLHATVFETDDEAYAIWRDHIQLPEDRIHRLGATENFWQMGQTGPCGPCTEILIDRGPQHSNSKFDSSDIANQGERYLEVWNLVFMQFDREADGIDKPLSRTGVDTGMGLARLAMIVQNKDSVYETDLFTPLIKRIEKLSNIKYTMQDQQTKSAFHVLADHIRSSCLIIADGGAPSNEGRGYVLRKIIRRAALFAQKLEAPELFGQLAPTFIDFFSPVYPELKQNSAIICNIITSEIEKFSENLVRGQHQLEQIFQQEEETKHISGAQAFKLYDTYGFPRELIEIISAERTFTVDTKGFDQRMQHQRQQSGAKTSDILAALELPLQAHSIFTGYQELQTQSTIAALIIDHAIVDQVQAGQSCWIVPQESPFFIIGGGQVPDHGTVTIADNTVTIEQVRHIGQGIGIQIIAPVALHTGMPLNQQVDSERRTNAMKNHTATHLLQAALIELFGKQIKQSGSLVHPDYLRFDFTFHRNLSSEEIEQVERLVNQKIRDNISVSVVNTNYKDAVARGALAFFGDKYNPENVRMIAINDFSIELCGGTHVTETGAIGAFKITQVGALSAGHRRIIAVTGPGAISLFQQIYTTMKGFSEQYKVPINQVQPMIEKQREQLANTEKRCQQISIQLAQSQIPLLLSQVQQVGSAHVLVHEMDAMNITQLKKIAQKLNSAQPGFYVLTSADNGKVVLYAQADQSVQNTVDTRIFARWLQQYSIRGGGKPGTVQGGGPRLPEGFQTLVLDWIAQQTSADKH